MNADIKKVEEKIEFLSSDPKALEHYKARERSLQDRANMISSAKEDGINEKAIEDAINFLKLGINEEIVSKGTGLSIEKILEIKKEMIK